MTVKAINKQLTELLAHQKTKIKKTKKKPIFKKNLRCYVNNLIFVEAISKQLLALIAR